jgi:hypothetical protein
MFRSCPLIRVERARARFWVKFEDDVLHPVIRPATFDLMMSPELARRSDRELDDMVKAHPNRQRACGRVPGVGALEEACLPIPSAILS